MALRFFGYGSLVNAKTHSYTNIAPARLKGWRRRWAHRINRNGLTLTSLTITPVKGAETLGAVAKLDGGDWSVLDAREIGYERQPQPADAFSPEMQSVSIYKSLAENNKPGNEAHPILQSYLDCVLQGFLQMHGDQAAADFIATTDGWDTPILQDRAEPIYPRAIELTIRETALIDGLVHEMPKLFRSKL